MHENEIHIRSCKVLLTAHISEPSFVLNCISVVIQHIPCCNAIKKKERRKHGSIKINSCTRFGSQVGKISIIFLFIYLFTSPVAMGGDPCHRNCVHISVNNLTWWRLAHLKVCKTSTLPNESIICHAQR